ncbi:Nramp family divalent metal transporter [Vibrio sp. SS-MA-C1-2]|uniref:Nramp family divalent metal transporter n=1 Tax=Vibrio sp. SS-MA-C1-2 TaxID=2908646 RepID=UPI001F416BBF|nr:Nramp family divalent metal transporter [Vibrio sp. SS-MA-C1-2]UJF16912.1 Nramp family divalent metal transporter [Vibrio sp. SS-MA-C1-2]
MKLFHKMAIRHKDAHHLSPSAPSKKFWFFLGPAFVAAIGYIDPGNYATNIQAGAQYGYILLWVVVAANLMAALIQFLSSKLGLVSQKSLANHIRDHVSTPVRYGYWIQAEITAMATDLAEFVGASLGFHLVLGISLMEGAICTAVLSWLILILQGRSLKKLEFVIGVMLAIVCVMYIAELVFAHPDPTKVIEGMLIPEIPDENALYLATGILGATIMPHVIYLHSSLSKGDKTTLTEDEKSKAVKSSYWDVGIAMCIASFVNLAMLAMAAAVFFGLPDAASHADLTNAYKTLTPILGDSASLIFGLSLVVAGVASTVVGTLAGQEMMQDFVLFKIPVSLRRFITMLPSFVVIYYGFNVTEILVMSQVVLSFGIALAVIPLVIFCSNKKIMGEFVISKMTKIIGWAVIVVIVSLNVFLIATSL